MIIATEIKTPDTILIKDDYLGVFLGGSAGNEDWRTQLMNALREGPFVFLNPNRVSPQSNPIELAEQVKWELNALAVSDISVMCFDDTSISPLAFLEIGLQARSRKLIIYCPADAWVKTVLEVASQKYNFKLVNSIDDMINSLKQIL